MTIAGFHVISPQRAIAWADDETFVDNEPFGAINKLLVNGLAGFLTIGLGSVMVLNAAAAVLHEYTDIDDAAARLPRVLAAARHEAASVAARTAVRDATIALVGRSPRFGRAVGYLLCAAYDFRPGLSRAWCAPAISSGAEDVVEVHGALAAAQAQLAVLREVAPLATGGTLAVAELDGGRIIIGAVAVLATGLRPGRQAPPVDGARGCVDRAVAGEGGSAPSVAGPAGANFRAAPAG